MLATLDQTFSYTNLLRVRRRIDASLFPERPSLRNAKIRLLAAALDADTFAPTVFFRSCARGFVVYSTDSLENTLVLRKINDSIRRLYNVKQSDRTSIVRQVGSLLREGAPKTVLKLDLASFYDNVDRTAILEKLKADNLLSCRSVRFLEQFFATSFPNLGCGVPRGVCVSATLAELVMRDFDSAVRSLQGVYFYARYVDDIVVFTYGDPHELRDSIEKMLPKGMRFNRQKSMDLFKVKLCKCEPYCRHAGQCPCKQRRLAGKPCKCRSDLQVGHKMDFLGYRFLFPRVASREEKAGVQLSIAASKVRKTKSRLIAAARDFHRTGDYSLLQDRFEFLTGNYKVTIASNDKRIKTGIFYNYRLMELYQQANEIPVLRELNGFLRSLVLSTHFDSLRRLNTAQRLKLSSFSFVSGYRTRRLVKFSPSRIYQLKECWRDV
jgi:hypothetical protein